MRVLFDECVPRPFRKELPGHEVRTVTEMGWQGKTNGELLKVMTAEGFTVFVTVDQNIPFQQNLKNATIAVVILVATDNTLDALRPLVAELLSVLSDPKPGQVVRIGD